MKKRKLIAFICIIVNILLLQAGFYIIALDETEPLGLIVSDYEIIDLQTDNAPPLQSLYDSTELQPIMVSVSCNNNTYYKINLNTNQIETVSKDVALNELRAGRNVYVPNDFSAMELADELGYSYEFHSAHTPTPQSPYQYDHIKINSTDAHICYGNVSIY